MGALPADITPGVTVPYEEQEAASRQGWTLKKLSPWHKNMCSMLAQGIPRSTIAACLDCAPEYVSALARQPLIIEQIQELSAYANLQLEAQFTKSVTAIGETLDNGNAKERMQAARLHAELTNRVGPRAGQAGTGEGMEDRLLSLSERLVGLLQTQRMANTQSIIEGEAHEIQNAITAEDRKEDAEGQGNGPVRGDGQSAQADGDGVRDSERQG